MTSLQELSAHRDARLVKTIKVLLGVALVGFVVATPAILPGTNSSDQGLVMFASITILMLIYAALYVMTRCERYGLARVVLFGSWISYACLQLMLFSPFYVDPMLGTLMLTLGCLFSAVIVIGVVTLERWDRARIWLGVFLTAFLIVSVVQALRFCGQLDEPRLYITTLAVSFLFFIYLIALARAFTLDLQQLLERSDEARARELTLREQTESARDEAREASRIKSQFLANMSHELRTPLGAIIGYTELIEEEAEELELHDFDADLAQIRRAAKHLHELINDILDLSKIEAGKLELDPQPVDCGELLGTISELVSPLLKKNHNAFELQDSSTLRELYVDEVRLKQVLLNLLSNAAKFTCQGRVTLRCEDARGEGEERLLRLAVEDTGVGIEAAKQQRIFEAFEQADSSTTRRYGGTGLGLPITRRLVEMMGGRLTLESELGAGSLFAVELPHHALKAQGATRSR